MLPRTTPIMTPTPAPRATHESMVLGSMTAGVAQPYLSALIGRLLVLMTPHRSLIGDGTTAALVGRDGAVS